MKQEKGITLVALIIIFIIVGVVISIGWKYTKQDIDKQKDEDIKSNLLAIQSVITNIENKHLVDEEANPLVGIKLDLENNETEYQISEELKQSLLSIENAELYILNQDELTSCGIKNVDINATIFYVVDYNTKEIFYSLGINGKYKLSEM